MQHKFLFFHLLIVSWINNIFIYPFLLLNNTLLLRWSLSYFISISGLIKYFYNISIHVNNMNIIDDIIYSDKSKSIVIQNHLSQFDFLFISSLISNNNIIPNINMKMLTFYDLYLYLPGFGLVCYLLKNIMITYNKIKNIKLIENCEINSDTLLWFYPEGNVYCKRAKDVVDKYCDNNNLPKMKNCLYPRSGAVEILQKNNKINTIYSVTTQYDNIKPSDKYHSLVNSNLPSNVYFKLDKHHVMDNDIFNKTVEIFHDMDNNMDKDIINNEYKKLDNNYIEILCILIQGLFFILCCYMMYQYYFMRLYFISGSICYYAYLYFDIK